MKIKFFKLLVLSLSVLCLSGCSLKENIHGGESEALESYVDSKEEAAAIKEEEEALEKAPTISYKPDELMKKLLGENDFLVDVSDEDAGEVMLNVGNEDETFTIYFGRSGDETIPSIVYDINDDDPMKNETLKKELFATVKTIMSALDEEYKVELIEEAINKIKIGEVTDSIYYSDNLSILLVREEGYFELSFNPTTEK